MNHLLAAAESESEPELPAALTAQFLVLESAMKRTLIVAMLLALAGTANAASYSYSFADVLESTVDSKSVASLLVADGAHNLNGYANSVGFSLTNSFSASLRDASAAKVKELSFSGVLGGSLFYGTATTFQFASNGGADFSGPTYKVVFNPSNSKSFGDGETASWTVYSNAALNASDFSNFVLQINATGGYQNATSGALTMAGATSLRFAPTAPVPEPETYAMLLAGLGLMATIARRRRQA